MAWYGKPNLDDYKYTKEMNMTKKEHTEIIDLVKNEHKSPLEALEISYDEHKDLSTLSMHLKVLLNGKQIGTIMPVKSDYHPYSFKSMSAICDDISAKEVNAIKIEIEKRINRIVNCFKEW